jgi:predicted pyridoxine 5'-phosphate oxidase superfamily flavin-nucleotide-binding protein
MGDDRNAAPACAAHLGRSRVVGVSLYHEGSRQLQDAFDTRRLADRLEEVKVTDTIGPRDREFIESMDMLFLATADEQGRPNCSYKGGDPGFVRVVDEHTVAFPCYDGNGMFLSAGNVLVNPEVGLLFISFERGRRLRLNGTASIDPGDELAAAWPGAQFVLRVRAREVFPNCPRYIHRYRLVERSRFVPRGAAPPPVPDWKRRDWARDVLPAGDPAAKSEPGGRSSNSRVWLTRGGN